MRILIVDDDKKLANLLREYLESNNYSVRMAYTGEDGLDLALSDRSIQLVILDVMLPGLDGFEVLKRLRKSLNTPVIMLTARGDDVDKIVGLEVGADDYLSKPFNKRELLARINAVRRRYEHVPERNIETLSIGNIKINKAERVVKIDNKECDITGIEFDILYTLMRNKGITLSREQILENIYSRTFCGLDRSIDVHVSKLRSKIGSKYIKTVYGIGYTFVEGCESER